MDSSFSPFILKAVKHYFAVLISGINHLENWKMLKHLYIWNYYLFLRRLQLSWPCWLGDNHVCISRTKDQPFVWSIWEASLKIIGWLNKSVCSFLGVPGHVKNIPLNICIFPAVVHIFLTIPFSAFHFIDNIWKMEKITNLMKLARLRRHFFTPDLFRCICQRVFWSFIYTNMLETPSVKYD